MDEVHCNFIFPNGKVCDGSYPYLPAMKELLKLNGRNYIVLNTSKVEEPEDEETDGYFIYDIRLGHYLIQD